MTRTIIVNDHEFPAFEWVEAEASAFPGAPSSASHSRSREILENGVSELRPGEAEFRCDQAISFDTTFELKGEGRKFVVISHRDGIYVAKPY